MKLEDFKIDLVDGTLYVWVKDIRTRAESDLVINMIRISQRAIDQCKEIRSKFNESASHTPKTAASKDENTQPGKVLRSA